MFVLEIPQEVVSQEIKKRKLRVDESPMGLSAEESAAKTRTIQIVPFKGNVYS